MVFLCFFFAFLLLDILRVVGVDDPRNVNIFWGKIYDMDLN